MRNISVYLTFTIIKKLYVSNSYGFSSFIKSIELMNLYGSYLNLLMNKKFLKLIIRIEINFLVNFKQSKLLFNGLNVIQVCLKTTNLILKYYKNS